jgi:ABC-type antimicrobial peptide transport system permease subunit
VAAAVQAAEPRAAFVRAEPVGDVMLRGALAPYRLTAATFTAFGLLALAVAAVGLYGAVAYTVAQRTREFGVRAALGAGARDLVRLVLGQGLRTVAVGAVIGAVGAVAAGRLLQGKLYGVDPLDPLTLAATGLVLAAAALLATWLPARRAARVDPAVALRAE